MKKTPKQLEITYFQVTHSIHDTVTESIIGAKTKEAYYFFISTPHSFYNCKEVLNQWKDYTQKSEYAKSIAFTTKIFPYLLKSVPFMSTWDALKDMKFKKISEKTFIVELIKRKLR